LNAYGATVPVSKDIWLTFGPVDYSNESLLNNSKAKLSKIYERVPKGKRPLVNGPETPVINPVTGKLFVLTEDGNLVSLTDFEEAEPSSHAQIKTAKATVAMNLGVGRPLGGKFTKDGKTLYIADTLLGLLRVKNLEDEDYQSKVEIVASSVVDTHGIETKLNYANDVDIGPVTGHVYFTDSTDIAPERLESKKWDTMTGFKRDYARGQPTGRLLRYNPSTDKVDILATGIWFANGVAVMDEDESALMISETSMARALKYYLKGPKEGSIEVLSDHFPGFPDGGACSEMGFCYAPLPSLATPLFTKMSDLPEAINTFVRTLILMLPAELFKVIKVVKYGGVVEIPVGEERTINNVGKERILQDPFAKEIGMITGVATFKNKIYLGSLSNDFVGVVDLEY